jgi:hypothetical protein
MGTEFLVACLWVVVFVYWFWSRLPARADTVGVYRRALHVLEHAAPTRVVPAYRLRTPAIPSAAAPFAAVALCHKRAQLRRRRRDTLSVLLGAVLVSIAAALATRSAVAFAAQVLCDIALGSYVSLLVRAARASAGATPWPSSRRPSRRRRSILAGCLGTRDRRLLRRPCACGLSFGRPRLRLPATSQLTR